MLIVTDAERLAQYFLEMENAEDDASAEFVAYDPADFSEEAVERARDQALKPLVKKAMSLESLDQRIATVRAQIETIWNSALPHEEKVIQVQARKNEISLLQAGQFEFAKAGFYRAA